MTSCTETPTGYRRSVHGQELVQPTRVVSTNRRLVRRDVATSDQESETGIVAVVVVSVVDVKTVVEQSGSNLYWFI